MNVIGSRPNGWWRDRPAAMRRLVERLERFAADEDVPVTVVFDGRPVPVDAGRVQVVFASRSGPNAADDDIAALVAGSPKPAALRVVTSDTTLAGRVQAAGGEVEGAGPSCAASRTARASRGSAPARRRAGAPCPRARPATRG